VPRLPTQSAVLSPETNIDFHVFRAIQALQAQARLTAHTITQEHIRVLPVLVYPDVYVGTRQLALTSASSPPLQLRLSPRTSSLQIDPSQTYPMQVPVNPGCQGTRWTYREKEEERERERERERETEREEGRGWERAGRVVASAQLQRKGLKTSPLLSQPSSYLGTHQWPNFYHFAVCEIISQYYL